MPIVQKTPKAAIQSYVIKRTERIQQAIIYNLLAVGEKVVNAARTTSQKGRDFTDQTGNLRSSIGYVIAVDGQIVKTSSFDTVKEGADGSREGKAFAERLTQQYPKGIVLLVVAGKNYAKYVAARGFDVLDTAELLAQQLVPQMLKQLGM
jgi:hypothetical protein